MFVGPIETLVASGRPVRTSRTLGIRVRACGWARAIPFRADTPANRDNCGSDAYPLPSTSPNTVRHTTLTSNIQHPTSNIASFSTLIPRQPQPPLRDDVPLDLR